jgi:predicted PurR-regulated permease PerM
MIQLSSRQQTAVATALTILAAAIILCTVLGLAWLAVLFMRRFSAVFLPLAFGGIAALVFRPYYMLLHEKLRLPMPLALLTLFVSALIPLGAFGWFFGALLVEQVRGLATQFPEWWEKTVAELRVRWPEVQLFLEENPWGQRLKSALEWPAGPCSRFTSRSS